MVRLLFILACGALFTGCASTQENSSRREQERVSSIPWNRPERWEGTGPLGGMMNTM